MKIFGWILIGAWVVYNIFLMKIFALPLMIAQDLLYGVSYTIGTFAVLGVGIWLAIRKKREKSSR